MILEMFSVYDTKVKSYLAPMYARTLGEAFRVFSDIVNTADHQFHKHPDDYILFHVGQFDDSSAGLVQVIQSKVATAREVLEQVSSVPDR